MISLFKYSSKDLKIVLFSFSYNEWYEEDITPLTIAYFQLTLKRELFPKSFGRAEYYIQWVKSMNFKRFRTRKESIENLLNEDFEIVNLKELLNEINTNFKERKRISIPNNIYQSLINSNADALSFLDEIYIVISNDMAVFMHYEDDGPNGYIVISKDKEILYTFIGNYFNFTC